MKRSGGVALLLAGADSCISAVVARLAGVPVATVMLEARFCAVKLVIVCGLPLSKIENRLSSSW